MPWFKQDAIEQAMAGIASKGKSNATAAIFRTRFEFLQRILITRIGVAVGLCKAVNWI